MIEPALLKMPIGSPALISIKDYRMQIFIYVALHNEGPIGAQIIGIRAAGRGWPQPPRTVEINHLS